MTRSAEARRQVVPSGHCLYCGHHQDAHTIERPWGDNGCDVEVLDYGETDCTCPGLKLCAACEGDPEAHDWHVCDRRHPYAAGRAAAAGDGTEAKR